jgi:hypothetical protein
MIRIRMRQAMRLNGEEIAAGEEFDAQDSLAVQLLLCGAAAAVDKVAALERICLLLDAADSAAATPPTADALPFSAAARSLMAEEPRLSSAVARNRSGYGYALIAGSTGNPRCTRQSRRGLARQRCLRS